MPQPMVLLASLLKMFFNHFLEEVVGIEGCGESSVCGYPNIAELHN